MLAFAGSADPLLGRVLDVRRAARERPAAVAPRTGRRGRLQSRQRTLSALLQPARFRDQLDGLRPLPAFQRRRRRRGELQPLYPITRRHRVRCKRLTAARPNAFSVTLSGAPKGAQSKGSDQAARSRQGHPPSSRRRHAVSHVRSRTRRGTAPCALRASRRSCMRRGIECLRPKMSYRQFIRWIQTAAADPVYHSLEKLPICSKRAGPTTSTATNQSRAVLAALNSAGPWRWVLGESAVYGDYLNCRPMEHVRLRLHEYPQMLFVGFRDKGFSALLEIRAEGMATRSEIDGVFRRLLQGVDATNITEIEPYD